MTQPYAPPRSDGTAVRIVTAVIAALAVVGVVLVMALTDTSTAPTAQGGGLGGGSTADSGAIPGSSGTGGSGGTSGRVPTSAELRAEFPLPTGASRIPTPESEKYGAPGAIFYQVRGTLESVRGFYVSSLARLGVDLGEPNGTTSSENGQIHGYYYSYSVNPLDLTLTLSSDRGVGIPVGSVRIKVKFGA